MNIQKRIAQIRMELSLKENLSLLSTDALILELSQLEDEWDRMVNKPIRVEVNGGIMSIEDAQLYDFK